MKLQTFVKKNAVVFVLKYYFHLCGQFLGIRTNPTLIVMLMSVGELHSYKQLLEMI